MPLPYIMTSPDKICRIRTPLSKASTRKSLAENGYSRPLPSGTGVIRTIRTRMLLPPSEELTTAITSKNITCPLPLYTGYGTIFLSPCPPTEASIRWMPICRTSSPPPAIHGWQPLPGNTSMNGWRCPLLLWQLSSTRKLKTEVVPATTGSCLPMSASR